MATYRHDTNELAWSSEGSVSIKIGDVPWVVSPEQAVWIPAGLSHKVPSAAKAVLFPLHFDTATPGPTWREVTSIWVGPDLRSQIIRFIQSKFGESDPADEVGRRLLKMLPAHAQVDPPLPIPTDPRANFVAQALLTNPADTRSIGAWAAQVNASSKTLQRAFVATTGLNFVEWRARARLSASLPLLAQGIAVAQVAGMVGYTSAAGFITAFRRQYGNSPAAHIAARRSHEPAHRTDNA